jgi:hypothetical protein
VNVREKRLQALLEGRSPEALGLERAVADAQLLGSLELAGIATTWDEVRSPEPPAAVEALRRAQGALAGDAPFSVSALEAWHAQATGSRGLRTEDAPADASDRPPPAPGAFVRSRLDLLEEWVGGASGQELSPLQAAALVLARVVEIRPFVDGNGRVARLAASHLMVRGGLRRPILAGGDRLRLEACLRAAFQLDTEPLATLLHEASDRALDVMIQSLQRP